MPKGKVNEEQIHEELVIHKVEINDVLFRRLRLYYNIRKADHHIHACTLTHACQYEHRR